MPSPQAAWCAGPATQATLLPPLMALQPDPAVSAQLLSRSGLARRGGCWVTPPSGSSVGSASWGSWLQQLPSRPSGVMRAGDSAAVAVVPVVSVVVAVSCSSDACWGWGWGPLEVASRVLAPAWQEWVDGVGTTASYHESLPSCKALSVHNVLSHGSAAHPPEWGRARGTTMSGSCADGCRCGRRQCDAAWPPAAPSRSPCLPHARSAIPQLVPVLQAPAASQRLLLLSLPCLCLTVPLRSILPRLHTAAAAAPLLPPPLPPCPLS